MPNAFGPRDVELLGYADAQVRSTPDNRGYTIIDATAVGGLETIRTQFVYLKSKCTLDDAKSASSQLNPQIPPHIVTPPSLRLDARQLRPFFGTKARISLHEDLVWQVLSTLFDGYLQNLSTIHVDEHFIPPRSVDDGIGTDLVPKLIQYMSGGNATEHGTLRVLSAHAGVGKTTVSRYLMRQLLASAASYKTIPLYIESEHWQKLDLSKVDGLWDVIDVSLREVSPSLGLSESLFQHALTQGYLSFVFDGFDELCGHDRFSPTDTLRELATILYPKDKSGTKDKGTKDKSEARILLTTRTLFWNSRLNEIPDNVAVWEMDAFNAQQAKGYLGKVFGESTENARTARRLYGHLSQETATPREHVGSVRAQFVNLPFCVRVIADFVERGGEFIGRTKDHPVLQSILLALCEREIGRQGLTTPVEQQLESFRDVAVAYPDSINPQFGVEDLHVGFHEEDWGKVVDHALVVQALGDTSDRKYRFRYDFLGPHLRALAIAKWILDPEAAQTLQEVLKVMANEAEGEGHVLEQLTMLLAAQAVDRTMEKCREVSERDRRAAAFLFQVAQALLLRDPEVTTGEERASRLFARLSAPAAWTGKVETWTFRGLLEGLDLRGVSFVGCRFLNVIFKSCTADSTTSFTDCHFERDLRFEKGQGWTRVELHNCRMMAPTDGAWERVLQRKTVDHSERVGQLLRMGLRKFWRHGRVKKSLRVDDWRKGGLGQYEEAGQVLEEMIRVGLVERAHISGVEEGGVVFESGSIRDLQNYMDNSQRSGKIQEVYDRLLENRRR